MRTLLLLVMMPLMFKAQKIKESKKDDMTGTYIIKTSYERITGGVSSNWIKASVSSYNKSFFLDMNSSFGGAFFIVRKDADITIKLDNDSIIKLKTSSKAEASEGMGGKQAVVSCSLNPDQKQTLTAHGIAKIRIMTSEGYTDFEIKNNDIIKKEIELVEKELAK